MNGAIVAFLCGTAGSPGPAGTQVCPASTPEGVTISGTIMAANITPVPGPQQLSPGELAGVIAAMRAGVVYANVHTNLSPGGEIRGQLHARNHRGAHDHGHHHH